MHSLRSFCTIPKMFMIALVLLFVVSNLSYLRLLSTYDRVENTIRAMEAQIRTMEKDVSLMANNINSRADPPATQPTTPPPPPPLVPSLKSEQRSVFYTRDIPDARPDGCSNIQYPHDLPAASVIIVNYNERYSVLMRTVKSVLERTPRELLKQVIIVDDFSDNLIDSEIHILERVKVIRNEERKGLIHSRVIGANAATTPVIVFLDAHCEANYGWLEPLLARVKQDPTAVVWPVIDVIDYWTFAYSPIDSRSQTGGMKLETLSYVYDNIPASTMEGLKYPEDPIPSPTMPGGLFAIDKEFFFSSGSYDLGMGFWGTENIEMSVRIWTCGGSIEMIPCSHVGHIFTVNTKAPVYVSHSGTRNQIRMAEVWLDDYKSIFYENYYIKPQDIIDAGNVTDRIEFRKKMKCKSFKWYHEHIYPYMSIPQKYYEKKPLLNIWKPN